MCINKKLSIIICYLYIFIDIFQDEMSIMSNILVIIHFLIKIVETCTSSCKINSLEQSKIYSHTTYVIPNYTNYEIFKKKILYRQFQCDIVQGVFKAGGDFVLVSNFSSKDSPLLEFSSVLTAIIYQKLY